MEVRKEAEHTLSHSVLGDVTVSLYGADGFDRAVVMSYGKLTPNRDTLVRIQSACLYGDTLKAADCDCRGQIDETFLRMLEAGAGLLIYLRQEGRGAGLIDKARAYELAERDHLDTVQAYEALKLPVDSRDYSIAIEIIRDYRLNKVVLLTNNPRKVDALTKAGLKVRREPSDPQITESNIAYLRTKQLKLDHELALPVLASEGAAGPNVFVVGAAVIDHVFSLPADPEVGKARQANTYTRRPGGKGLNQAIGLTRLGAHTTLLTVLGHDMDTDAIVSALAKEGVHLRFGGEADREHVSPQTAVLQPQFGAPTYVGWLGEEHRTLRQHAIEDCRSEIKHADAVLMTLEASEAAIQSTLTKVCSRTLTVLCASPAQESPYHLQTRTLERVDVLIGSPDELRALLRGGDPTPDGAEESGEAAAKRLTDLLAGPTVILADFRQPVRRAFAFHPELSKPVIVRSPDVRTTAQISAAVGNTDVFCAATTIEILKFKNDVGPNQACESWRSSGSPLADETNLVDILMKAVQPEAYVAASTGGYTAFPRNNDADFRTWCSRHPPTRE